MARRSYWGYWDFGERDYDPRPSEPELRRRLGRDPDPVRGQGQKLAQTFWGRAWCNNLHQYHDYANRLPRGRTYLRQGAVLDLAIGRGSVTALVFGHSLYEVRVDIEAVARGRWAALRKQCAGGLSSVIELLEGRIGNEVMEAVTAPRTGLFPEPRDIRLACSCPDWASMCKHVAAALYGVGIRLDERPQLLFELRGVDPQQLVGSPKHIVGEVAGDRRLDGELSDIFGVQIEGAPAVPAATRSAKKASTEKASAKKASTKKASTRKASAKKASTKKASTKKASAKKRTSNTTRGSEVIAKPRTPTVTKVVEVIAMPKTKKKRASSKRGKPADIVMTRQQLLATGLPASTLQGWLRRRVLRPTDTPGVYGLTKEAQDCLEWYR
ncbi:SWIM zinc finger family protein [Paraliomyxa miuraensis]|uniref:SWIM zinc finger family protein n=1 Tax=Paraliomyxa miuraensis TaxID=376150 RepID=UPI002254521A|nr:hypothetical protein [Paraliomyxa miuraensis]MCX4243994.1 hypothetical protein [Paraliomyxa miuraensis]